MLENVLLAQKHRAGRRPLDFFEGPEPLRRNVQNSKSVRRLNLFFLPLSHMRVEGVGILGVGVVVENCFAQE
jgi:hypothetical protein